MENILVTGGLGYIGSHVTLSLFKKKKNVIIVDDLRNSSRSVLYKLIKISRQNIPFYKCDVSEKIKIKKILKKYKIKNVIHLAASKSVTESLEKPYEYFENNLLSCIKLTEAMSEINVKNLIFSSSAVIYGSAKKIPYLEKSDKFPQSPYGFSKLMCENFFENLCKVDKSWKIMSLRYFNPVGSHKSGLIGDRPKNPDNLMPRLCISALNGDDFSIYGNNYNTRDGTAVRDFIHVEDVANAHLNGILKLKNLKNYSAFNIGTGRGTTVKEIVNTFQKVNNVNLSLRNKKKRVGDIPISYAKCKKAEEILNWKSSFNIEEMCKSAFMFYKKI